METLKKSAFATMTSEEVDYMFKFFVEMHGLRYSDFHSMMNTLPESQIYEEMQELENQEREELRHIEYIKSHAL